MNNLEEVVFHANMHLKNVILQFHGRVMLSIFYIFNETQEHDVKLDRFYLKLYWDNLFYEMRNNKRKQGPLLSMLLKIHNLCLGKPIFTGLKTYQLHFGI